VTLERLRASLADRYRLDRELGQGGMATVYLAQDLRHDRQVALKVLRPELSAILGAERFLHEIKTTANLQHPHILSLFDSGEAEGLVFYVMPFVDGESLRDRLTREKQLPVEDAVRIAREVADALEYAHQRGIVHRDIKPENILLHGGHALVADFGIALAASRSDGGTRMTETGMSLGTPHYMAPEQAMGEREVTARADIYALGCVLYEMLTAEPPFTGATAQAIIARVMTEEPRSLTLQRKSIPPNVEAVVETALQKLPADRFASAAQFGEALARPEFGVAATRAGAALAGGGRPAGVGQRLVRALPWAVATLSLVAAAWLATHRPRPVPPPVVAFDLSFGPAAAAANAGGSPVDFAPDGSRIAYVGTDSSGTRQLFLRSLDRPEPVPVPGTVDASNPFFSPDGAWLGFVQDRKLRKVALAGGAVVTICDPPGGAWGPTWGAGDVIVYSGPSGRLSRVSAAGGRPEDIAVPDSLPAQRASYRFPELLPGGKAAVFTNVTDSGPGLWAVTLGDGRVMPLDQPGMSPHYVEGGYLVYAEGDGTLFTRPFDPEELRFTGPAQPVVGGVQLGPAQVAKIGVARTGALVYLQGDAGLSRQLVLVGRDGRATAIPAPQGFYGYPRFSPDGRRISLTRFQVPLGSGNDVWIWDLDAGNMQRVTYDSASQTAAWMAGGRRLVYSHGSAGAAELFTISTDGSGRPESLLARPAPIYESSPTPDGRALVFREMLQGRNRDIWIAPLDSLQAARPLLATPFDERNPAVSPDGRWLAYASNETGQHEVYVRGLAEGSGRTRVSTDGGVEPRWAHSGRELFYRSLNGDTVYAASVIPGPAFRAGPPRSLFTGNYASGNPPNWDVAPDDRQFVMLRNRDPEQGQLTLHVILHWFDQLRAAGR
jgi:Tol biopolymer transport system component